MNISVSNIKKYGLSYKRTTLLKLVLNIYSSQKKFRCYLHINFCQSLDFNSNKLTFITPTYIVKCSSKNIYCEVNFALGRGRNAYDKKDKIKIKIIEGSYIWKTITRQQCMVLPISLLWKFPSPIVFFYFLFFLF